MSFRVLHDAPLAALAIDGRGVITDVNAGFARVSGLAADHVLQQSFQDLLPATSEGTDDFGLLTSGTRCHAVLVRAFAMGPAAGKRVRITLWRYEGAVYGFIQPLGEQEEAAAVLTESASLVAHEIRNPLAGIGSALVVIADRLPEGGAEREVISEIRARLNRLNDQVDDLMLLVRPVRFRKQECDLQTLVATACRTAGLPPPAGAETVALHADPDLVAKAIAALIRYAAGPAAVDVGWRVKDGEVSIQLSGGRLAAMTGAAAAGWSPQGRQDGLELPVARRVAEVHDGRLDADVTPSGVVLRLELPLEDGHQTAGR